MKVQHTQELSQLFRRRRLRVTPDGFDLLGQGLSPLGGNSIAKEFNFCLPERALGLVDNYPEFP